MQTEGLRPFHIAVPVNNLDKAREFYGGILQCKEGRTHEGKWIDYDFFGHQLVAHFASETYKPVLLSKNGVNVPSFGVTIEESDFEEVKKRIDTKIQFTESNVNSKKSIFLKDFTGNQIQIKSK